MSYYVEKIKRQKGYNYRIVMDIGHHGERKRKYFSLPVGTTKAQAEQIRCEMELQAGFGEFITKQPILFQEYVEDVYFPKYTGNLAVTTVDNYKQMYYAPDGIKKHLGSLFLSEIRTEIIQDMVNYYDKTGKSGKSIRNIVNLISVILKRAKIDNYLKKGTVNPCEYLVLPKLRSKEGNAYSIEEVRLMLDRAVKSDNINMQLLLALCCFAGGLRRSELTALRWDDITLGEKDCYIQVKRAEVSVKGEIIEKETKTKAGYRTIPIPKGGIVYNTLHSAKKMYLKEQSDAKDFRGNNHVFILHREPHTPVNGDRLYKIYKTFLERECPDLPHYRLHDLRHTYFTLCSEIEGFSELSIIKTGGHSSIQSTKRYQHATMERMKADMKKLDAVFQGVNAITG